MCRQDEAKFIVSKVKWTCRLERKCSAYCHKVQQKCWDAHMFERFIGKIFSLTHQLGPLVSENLPSSDKTGCRKSGVLRLRMLIGRSLSVNSISATRHLNLVHCPWHASRYVWRWLTANKAEWTSWKDRNLSQTLGNLTCCRDVSDIPCLANQDTQTRRTIVSINISVRQLGIISFRWALAHRRASW